jgi:hypothetical protein
MADLLKFVKTKNSLKKKEKIHSLKQAILNKVQNDLDLSKLRVNNYIDNDLILFVCLCLEQAVKKKYGIDKKEFCVEIINAIFSGALTLAEINQVNLQIQFAYDNELIKPVEFSYKAKVSVSEWFSRKFL